MTTFHLGLALGRFIPPVAIAIAIAIGPRLARLATRPRGRSAVADGPPDLIVEDIDLPATAGSPGMRIRLYRPERHAVSCRRWSGCTAAGWCWATTCRTSGRTCRSPAPRHHGRYSTSETGTDSEELDFLRVRAVQVAFPTGA
ncbi:hypothetical protein [Curtobacterium sp. MCBD17_030]|uniref:hypothetical protein n=1 Tax=Curtobacterium sp. MCBD17_030 TaxID=2175649 RepID=UPI000D9BA703|nr:hypothetical protein [Curtobacterium sp. MCBD17_030]PYY31562.1 hypothetical protein DEI89_16775 [Curtobacterium sp. MCBD17_030]